MSIYVVLRRGLGLVPEVGAFSSLRKAKTAARKDIEKTTKYSTTVTYRITALELDVGREPADMTWACTNLNTMEWVVQA